MEFVLVNGEKFSPSCSTLVMPALSIGNVAQLAVDLLIPSAKARRVAYLDEPSVLPCVGNDAFGPDAVGDLALALEEYESPSHGLAFIQQRSPVITGMMVSFAKNVANFISSIGKDHVVILSSIDSGKRRVIDASSDMVYYLSSCNEDGSDPEYEKLGWKKLEEYDPSQRLWKCLASLIEGGVLSEDMADNPEEMTASDYYATLPFAALFFACKAKGLKVCCVLCYCSEGDNVPESFHLAEAVCKLLGHDPEQLHGEVAIMDSVVSRIKDISFRLCTTVPEISMMMSRRQPFSNFPVELEASWYSDLDFMFPYYKAVYLSFNLAGIAM